MSNVNFFQDINRIWKRLQNAFSLALPFPVFHQNHLFVAVVVVPEAGGVVLDDFEQSEVF